MTPGSKAIWRRASAALVALFLMVAGVIGQDHAPAAASGTQERHAAPESKGDPGAIFLKLFDHILPHPYGVGHGHGAPHGTGEHPADPPVMLKLGGLKLVFFDINFHQLIALLAMLVVFLLVRIALVSGRPGAWPVRVFSGFVLWVRDEMVFPVLGHHHGKAFLPYFLFVFFFIAFMNLIGLIPGGLTATACIFVTAALACTTLVVMIGMGMKEQGAAAFWKNLVPHGLPTWLVPLMFVVELVGLIVKPFALTIRLFANMMAGHLVVLSCIGIILYFAATIGEAAYAVAVPSVGLAVFIMIIESFVALLQAYIFTYLSILFVAACMHPEH